MSVALPTFTVEVALATGANPAAWVLGVSPFPTTLAPATLDVYTDVTADVRSMTIKRGKQREQDDFGASTATIVLNNRSRTYDPIASPTTILPGRRIRINATHPTTAIQYTLFTGVVRDWRLDYTGQFDSTATAVCSDVFADLANNVISVTTSAATAATNIGEICAAAGIANYSASGGHSFQSMTFTNDALSALRTIENSEDGYLYTSTAGTLTFLPASAVGSQTRSAASQATFGSGNLGYQNPQFGFEVDSIKNKVTVTRQGGVAQTATDTISTANYGTRSMSVSGTANATDAQALLLAGWLKTRYSTPGYRVTGFTLQDRVHADVMTQALSRELLDRVTVTFSPPGGGSPISQDGLIIGITHRLDQNHNMATQYALSTVTNLGPWFTLGTVELGDTTGASAALLGAW